MTTKVYIILDMSGSMQSVWDATISGYNEYIQSLKADDNDYTVSLTLFDTVVEHPYSATPIQNVPKLTKKVYSPRGMTALYDAVCMTLADAQKEVKKRDKALIVIITDGEENSSKEYTEKGLTNIKDKLEKSGNWSFVYLGANQDAWAVAGKWGFSQGNTASYNATASGTSGVYAAMSLSTRSFAGSDSFTTDSYFSKRQKKDLKDTK